jgi:hypothetical protein
MEGKDQGSDANIHPDILCRKEKIFTEIDPNKRKTKIVCTLG